MVSITDRNLAQIGMRRNIFTGEFEPKGARSFGEKLVYATLGFFLTSLLSWFVYVVEIYMFIKRRITKWNRPKEIKRLDWVIKNHLLKPFDMVRFDIQISEIALGRTWTTEEYNNYQQDLTDRGIDVKIADVLAVSKT